MPCFSRVTKTQITNAARLLQAIKAVGLDVIDARADVITTSDGLIFQRLSTSAPFGAVGNTDRLAEIGRKYAELGVRAFATKHGMTITNQGSKLLLQKRG